MASTRRSDWRMARDDYMKELDDRFPDHPYQKQLRDWRDKLLLEDAEGRGNNLTSGLNINLTKPNSDTERQFKISHELAAAASERFDDITAARHWQNLADGLKEAAQPHKEGDPEERQWYLLALRRVTQLENAIKDRREYVLKQLELADAAFRGNRATEAVMIRSKLFDQFGKYTDLADIFQPAANVKEAETKEAHPDAATTSRSEEPKPAASPKSAAESKERKEQSGSTAPADSAPAGSPSSPPPKDSVPEL
jgi:hypothetical protein